MVYIINKVNYIYKKFIFKMYNINIKRKYIK